MARNRLRIIFACIVGNAPLFIPCYATAGVIRQDVPDSSYTTLAAQPEFAAVGKIVSTAVITASGTLIDSQWVLTAGHVVAPYPTDALTFTVNGLDYAASEWIPHSSWNGSGSVGTNGFDIGLVHLSAPVVGVTPAVRYTGSAELGATATIVGFGRFGFGHTGWHLPEGTKRAGHNVLDALGSDVGYHSNYLLADFDNPLSAGDNSAFSPSANPLPLEYSIAPGDSGGGAFLNDGGIWKLAGINSLVRAGPYSTGQPYGDGSADSDYGDVNGFTRVSAFNDWIDDQTSARYWNNVAGGTFHDNGNWEEGSVPGNGNLVVFDKAGAYTVNFSSSINNKRLKVRKGAVTLNLSGNTYTLGNTAAERSIAIGSAGLTITSGTLAAIDIDVGVNGSLTLNPGTTLQTTGKLSLSDFASVALNGNPASIGSFALDGGGFGSQITGSADLTANGVSTWGHGTMSGSGKTTIAVGGVLNVEPPGDSRTYLIGRTLENAGTINFKVPFFNADYAWYCQNATIKNLSGSTFNVPSGTSIKSSGGANAFINEGILNKTGTHTFSIKIPVLNSGTIDVQAGVLRLENSFFQSSPGRILLNGGNVLSTSVLTIGSGKIEGNGTVTASGVLNNGTISPGMSAGTLTFNSNLTLQTESQLIFELGGTGPGTTYDYIDVNGTFVADGMLRLSFINGFRSSVLASDTFTLLTANSAITGVFDNIVNGMRLFTTDGLGSFLVSYGVGGGAGNLVLSSFLPAQQGDFDGDLDVDGADFVAWQTHFPMAGGATRGMGDNDGDGDVDGADFVAWQTHFPYTPGSGVSPVPEPRASILGAIAVAILSVTRSSRLWARHRSA